MYGTHHSQRREYESRPELDSHPTRPQPTPDSHSTCVLPTRPYDSRVTRIHPLYILFAGYARTIPVCAHHNRQGRAVNGNKYCHAIQYQLVVSFVCLASCVKKPWRQYVQLEAAQLQVKVQLYLYAV